MGMMHLMRIANAGVDARGMRLLMGIVAHNVDSDCGLWMVILIEYELVFRLTIRHECTIFHQNKKLWPLLWDPHEFKEYVDLSLWADCMQKYLHFSFQNQCIVAWIYLPVNLFSYVCLCINVEINNSYINEYLNNICGLAFHTLFQTLRKCVLDLVY